MSLSDFVQLLKLTKTRAKDVLPITHHTQAAVSVHGRHPVTLPAATEWFRLLLCIVRRRRTSYSALRFCAW